MKILHSSDWQIGMRADGVGAVAARIRDERLDAARRVMGLAVTHAVDAVLLTGDVFEDNAVDRLLVRKVAEALRIFSGPIFIIPGNHDPLGPGSVWEHPVWKELANVTVFQRAEPYEGEGFTLFPCPLKEKYSPKNPTDWISAQASGKIAIGLAHGNVEGLPNSELDYPIERDAASLRGLDYLALGHWHSYARYDAQDGSCRMAYAGTHETTKFGERDSGGAVLVEIEKRGAPPKLTFIKTGALAWLSVERRIDQPGILEALASELNGHTAPQSTLVRVRLDGVLFPEDRGALLRLEEILASRFLFGSLDSSGLVPLPEGDAWINAMPLGPFREAAVKLRAEATGGGDENQRIVATHALLQLFELQAKDS